MLKNRPMFVGEDTIVHYVYEEEEGAPVIDASAAPVEEVIAYSYDPSIYPDGWVQVQRVLGGIQNRIFLSFFYLKIDEKYCTPGL